MIPTGEFCVMLRCFFFCKRKTAYELRISDGVQTCALPISAERKVAEREAKEAEAHDHRSGGQNGRQKPGKAVGPFQPDGPADLEQSGEHENGPSHGEPSFRSVQGPSPEMSG